ncbi:MAG: signal peptidase II [Suilimivivens sp.]
MEHSILKKGSIGLICSIALIFLDQWTKRGAEVYLKGKDALVLMEGVFELRYLENRGAAFGILQGRQVFLTLLTAIILVIVAYFYLKRIPSNKRFFWMNLTAVLAFSGAIGNLIDRISLHYVIDFLYFVLIDFPIFNVADIYVTIAACLLIVTGLFYYKEEDYERIFSSRSRDT